MERAHHGLARVLTIIVGIIGLIYAYWCLFDRQPPIKDVTVSLVEYNRADHYLVLDFSGYKNRRCEGERYQEIDEIGDEPPPKLRIPLEAVKLPPENFIGTALPAGQTIHWRRRIELPQNIPHPFMYRAEWAFHCNPAQTDIRSIYVKAPPLIVDQP